MDQYSGNLIFTRSETLTTPLVDKNGTIYISNGSPGIITALNPDGSVKWECSSSTGVSNRGLGIGKDGTIYAVEYGASLIAINSDGKVLWKIQNNNFSWGIIVNISFSPDGNTIYLHGDKVAGKETSLVAFDLVSKTIKWQFGKKLLLNGPVINSQGDIFVLVQDDTTNYQIANLYCLDPGGNVKWKFQHITNQSYFGTEPTIDKDGNIYFATDTLFAIDYYGNLMWKCDLIGNTNISPLVCDDQGTIYLGTSDNNNFNLRNILAFTKAGNLKWSLPVDGNPGDSPAISSNGMLIYPLWSSSKVVLIK